ncbi:MAG TPA: Crp/Fnr family transcriptional regulator [Bacteroidia bacterium]|jgi:CRP-like cAMP-binding protein|nr:Crp/Fnr family transcriptional regulator [Bacteroidia bacterium]
MKEETIFKNIARHIKLDEEEKKYFQTILLYKQLKKGEVLLNYGEICTHQYFVISGCLRNYSIDEYGKEHIMMFAAPDWWTSDMYSYVTGLPSEFIIDALVDTEVFEIRKTDMDKVYEQIPKFERFFRILFQNAIVNNSRRINSSMSAPAEDRYQAFIKQYPNIYQQIPLKYIASYLGISPEFLSKIRNKIAHS